MRTGSMVPLSHSQVWGGGCCWQTIPHMCTPDRLGVIRAKMQKGRPGMLLRKMAPKKRPRAWTRKSGVRSTLHRRPPTADLTRGIVYVPTAPCHYARPVWQWRGRQRSGGHDEGCAVITSLSNSQPQGRATIQHEEAHASRLSPRYHETTARAARNGQWVSRAHDACRSRGWMPRYHRRGY